MANKFMLHEIAFDDQPLDVDFHPTEPLLATSLITGHLYIHNYTKEATEQKHSLVAHDQEAPCRAVCFTLDGKMAVTGSLDKSILAVDVSTGKARARKRDAHDAGITRLLSVSNTGIASGDDEGTIKLWDSRQSDSVASLDPHTDYISDLSLHDHSLISVSGDGTLAVTDLRKHKVKATSEGDADDELLSVAVLKGGKKLVCGTTSGVLNIWSWGYWNDCSDRFPGHPESVTSLLKYDEDTLLTGSSDGMIRILGIQPNKMLGVLGEHADIDIERLAANAERGVLASVAHVNSVKLWDLGVLSDEGDDEEEEEDLDEDQEEKKGDNEKKVGGNNDADEEESDWGSDSDDDKGGRKRKKGKNKGAHKIPAKKQAQDANFFSDLL